MGLDMYLEGRKFFWHAENERREDGKRVRGVTVDLGYWRKHPDLHGFIVNTFADGKDECQEIELEADAIKQIIAAVEKRQLPHTEGFFFGASYASHGDATAKEIADEIADDVKQLRGALDWLTEGDADPFDRETETIGAGFTAVIFKPKGEERVTFKPKGEDRQKVTRTVVYRASW